MITDINEHEEKIHSRTGADGVIQAIFDEINVTNKFYAELGGDHLENNTRLLAKEGWEGVRIDSGTGHPVTAENVQELLRKLDVPTYFDLLSIDIKMNNYWIWKAVQDWFPRVVVTGYNGNFPWNKSLVIQYEAGRKWDNTDYFSATLMAITDLAQMKGYWLVGTDTTGNDAFFVKADLAHGHFERRDIQELYHPALYRSRPSGHKMLEV